MKRKRANVCGCCGRPAPRRDMSAEEAVVSGCCARNAIRYVGDEDASTRGCGGNCNGACSIIVRYPSDQNPPPQTQAPTPFDGFTPESVNQRLDGDRPIPDSDLAAPDDERFTASRVDPRAIARPELDTLGPNQRTTWRREDGSGFNPRASWRDRAMGGPPRGDRR